VLPAVIAARPPPRTDADPGRLRELILASAERPYQGYVDGRGEVGLPDLPVLDEVMGLVGGSTRIRAWYASPKSWRVAVLDQTGERDLYQTAQGTYVWDFERNLLTHIVGELPARLPWAADLTPPDLARRLLRGAAPDDPLTLVPSKRVAGVAAAGLRLTPSDADTTIGHVDVWADPATGLPVQVEVAARGSKAPVLTARFLELSQEPPGAEVLVPAVPASAEVTMATADDVSSTINSFAFARLPARIADRARVAAPAGVRGVTAVAAYGAGLSTFVVLALPGRVGFQSIQAARDAGGVAVEFPGAEAYEIQASLLAALVVRSDGDRQTRRSYLLVGPVTPDLLRRAAAELLAATRIAQ